jgi:hypothetical protein
MSTIRPEPVHFLVDWNRIACRVRMKRRDQASRSPMDVTCKRCMKKHPEYDWARYATHRDPAHKRARHVLRFRRVRRDPLCPVGMQVQSIAFAKRTYTPATANAWLARHGYKKCKPLHATANFLRARLHPPSGFTTIRTKRVGHGIELTVGCPKKRGRK